MSNWQEVVDAIRQRCAGRSWIGHGILLVLAAWFSIDPMLDSNAWSPVRWLSIAVHEAGHMTTRFWTPQFVSVAAGTLFQWGAPVLCAWLLWRRGEVFGVPIGLLWLGMSLAESVHYIADATIQAGVAISVGHYNADGRGIHDWNYLLSNLGLLGSEGVLAGLCRVASVLAMLAGLICGGWMVREMRRSAGTSRGG
jgi:hypothetical protein